jgi:hypothetical protein
LPTSAAAPAISTHPANAMTQALSRSERQSHTSLLRFGELFWSNAGHGYHRHSILSLAEKMHGADFGSRTGRGAGGEPADDQAGAYQAGQFSQYPLSVGALVFTLLLVYLPPFEPFL